MCGICGVFSFRGEPVDVALVSRMCSSLRHRGPDGEGTYVCGNIGLGHRRLSIIDLAGGSQPITNEDETMQIVFNGEIYNYIELRKQLLDKGHIFRTASDTEVILHGYEEWGHDCLRRLNGIFAFAIWDSRRRQLLLARDHLGVKPLYYSLVGTRLLFASEIKALLQDPECPRGVDLQAFGQLFTLRYVPSPATLFREIKKLPPAHCVTVSANGLKVERYWQWRPHFREATDEQELVEVYRDLIEDAVRLQMRSDVPVGLFLSSGVDSGALLALMSQHASRPVHTFTVGFEGGERSNETSDAHELARRFGADHSEIIVSPKDYLDYYNRYMWDIEEPVGNESAAAFYFVSRLASQKVKVALTGQGADEPWAGYHRYIGAMLSEQYSHLPRFVTDQIIRPMVMHLAKDEKLRRGVLSLAEPDVLTRLIKIYSFYSAEMKTQLFQPWLFEHISPDGIEARRSLQHLQHEVSGLDPMTQMLYIDARTNLPDDLLMVGDKTSMANSVEARVPFLDRRIVEFAESLRPNLKLRHFSGKYLHKKAIEKWIPREVVHRKKKGFANPVDQWLRLQMKPFVRECLLSEDAEVRRYFNREYIQFLVTQHEKGTQNHLRHIYLLISFELWHRQFMMAPVTR